LRQWWQRKDRNQPKEGVSIPSARTTREGKERVKIK
jgi:hypothetical protein